MTSINLDNLRFIRDLSISAMTKGGYQSALKLFDHFLTRVLDEPKLKDMVAEQLDADVEDILRGYSLWLRDTNIPKNYGNARDEDKEELPTAKSYMAASGLKEYLSKTILVLKEILPSHPFLFDEGEMSLLSGEKFMRGCKRSHLLKSDTFGVESKVGLYRVARYGPDGAGGVPHWTFLINCDIICKNMMNKTKTDDVYNCLTAKRLALVMNKHSVGRGGEFADLNIRRFKYDNFLDCADCPWTAKKTLKLFSCPFVPNKSGYATDVYHAFGCHAACGRGLYRQEPDKEEGYLFARQKLLSGSGASRWLTDAIRAFLPDQVPLEQRNSVSAVSTRIAGITEMAAGNVSFWSSHSRSGHSLPTTQERYWDREDVFCSLAAAKCLAGWDDFYGPVRFLCGTLLLSSSFTITN